MRSIGRGMGRQRIGIALIFALVLVGLVSAGHATTAPPDVAVSISGFAFHGPGGTNAITVPVGTRVVWTNNDGFNHTSTSDATPTPIWNSGPIAPSGTFSFTFTQTGVFPFHCAIHPSMMGTITVIAPPNPTGVTPATGSSAGGTNVTIAGTDFQSGATVTIGGIAATNVSVLDANTITATTPAHTPGTFDIVVTNPDSTAGTLSAGFTFTVVNSLPQPRPSAVPIGGANPLPVQRPQGASDPGSPNPLPSGRPAGGGAGSGASIIAPSSGAAAPAPLPPRR